MINFNVKASQQCSCWFSWCFAMVQVILSLSLLFIEFLGSCSRWSVTNGVVSCVMGPTGFYLKIRVNILNFRMLFCSWEYFRMLLYSWWSSSGFITIFIWVHHVWMKTWVSGFIICVSYDFLDIIHKQWLFHIHQSVAG